VTDPPIPLAPDLAPGDASSQDFDWTGLRLVRIDAVDHPCFSRAYDRLWREFGDRNEMEARDVIARRLADPMRRVGDRVLHYQMIAVLAGDDMIAVRDHTAIAGDDSVVVHLSHVVVEPPHRRTGLAGWLRALPLQAARAALPAARRVTLVAEMEHPDGTPDVTARLRSYGRAGFRMVDPTLAPYLQPDFRPPAVIDATSVQPVELALILRRVGDEAAPTIRGAELRDLVTALYTMYAAVGAPDAHMAPLWARLAAFPPDDAAVPLRPPLP
jgi:GNAT superfamily N-acetyltransferase